METRAQAKQQELQEQVSKLIGMIDSQRQRQEQLAAESQHHLTQLFSTQQKMQVTRLSSINGLLRNRRDSCADLLRFKRTDWRAIEQKQLETDELMKSLESDVTPIKGLFQSHLRKIEQDVDAVRDTKEQTARDLLAARSSCKEEVLSELQTKLGSTPSLAPALSIMSSASLPDAGTMEAQGGRAPKQITKPLPYDGQSSWEAYKLQFEMLAQLNGWSKTEKATYLAVSLRGSALTILTNLPPEQCSEYTSLLSALDNRFGTAHQTELNRVKLRNRTRKREESLPELAEDIKRLSRLAYPDVAQGMVDVLAKDQFIDAIADEDIRLRVRQNKSTSLWGALEHALERVLPPSQ